MDTQKEKGKGKKGRGKGKQWTGSGHYVNYQKRFMNWSNNDLLEDFAAKATELDSMTGLGQNSKVYMGNRMIAQDERVLLRLAERIPSWFLDEEVTASGTHTCQYCEDLGNAECEHQDLGLKCVLLGS